MRKFMVSLVVATLTLIAAAPAALAASGPFKGTYSALDVDGSRLTVSFSGSGTTRTVTLVDDRATCLGGAPLTRQQPFPLHRHQILDRPSSQWPGISISM